MKRLIAILLALFAAPVFAAGPVQVAHNHSTSGAPSQSMTITNSGDALLVVLVTTGTTSNFSLSSLTDNSSSITADAVLAFTTVEIPGGGNYVGEGVYVVQGASGAHSVAATFSYASAHATLYLAEMPWTGTLTIDQVTASIAQGQSTAVASNSITTTHNGDYLIGVLAQQGGTATYSGLSSPLAQGDIYNSADPSGMWAYGMQASAGAISASATTSVSAHWFAALVSISPAAGSTCTNYGRLTSGGFAIPNGTSGSYILANGSVGTPDCSTVKYCNKAGSCLTN